MQNYKSADIRNVCLIGHSSDGKTSLAESMLFLSKATDRLGKISDKNTVCDYDGDMIIFKGHLYYVEPYTGYIKHIRVASAEDYQTYISSQTSKGV